MLTAALLAASLCAAPPKPFTLDATVEGISSYRLPNGLTVLFFPDPSKPTVTVNLTVFVGSRHENYGEKGMAHLFEHMLFKETKKFKDIKQELTKHGADANGSTWFDRTNYFETLPATDENLKWAIEMEAERLSAAIISRAQLATEMTVVRNEFEMGENQPSNMVEERTFAAAYQWHNYGNTTIGAKSDIENVPNEKLQAFYAKWYQPDNAILIVAGKFDEKKLFGWVGDFFGRIPKPKKSPEPTYTVEPVQDGEKLVTVRRVGGTPELGVGYHVPAGTDPDFASIDILDRALGDAPSGRLYKELVDGKKAAKVSCGNYQLKEPGYFLCTAELRATDPAGPAKDAMLAVLESLTKKPLTAEEVDRAKMKLLKDYDLLLNQSDRVGITLSEFAALGDWRMFFVHRDRIRAVTAQDVNRVAQKYFKPSNRTMTEYVPTEHPDRAEIPSLVDLAPVLKGYTGDPALAMGEAFEATPKNIEGHTARSVLPDGLKLALLPKKTRGETVHLALELQYGTAGSLTGQRAVASFAAKMLLRGTKTRTRQQFKDELDKLKVALSVSPQPQGVVVSMEVRKPQLLAALELLAEAVKAPGFDPKEYESLRREVLADAEQRKDDPNALGFNALQRAMSPFPKGHPLYVPSYDEIIADAAAVKLEQSRDFHARFYGVQDGELAVVGDFDPKGLTEKVQALFGGFLAKEKYERVPNPYVAMEKKESSTQTPDKAMAFYGAALNFKLKDSDPDYPALMMADYMLGGGFLSGRVPKRLREKEGWSYGAGTSLHVDERDDNAFLFGYAIEAPQNTDKVDAAFHDEVKLAVDKGFTEAELKLAKEGLLQQRQQELADDDSLSMNLVNQLDVGRTMDFEQKLDERLKALTVKEVSEALKKYVDPARFTTVKAGDFKKVAAPKSP